MRPLLKDRIYLDELRGQLLTQIAGEWCGKWAATHGTDFVCITQLPSQNAFFDDLVEDMDKVLDQKMGVKSVEYFITKHTIRRFLDTRYEGGFNEKTKTAVAIYCGYADWADFVALYQPELTPPPPAPTVNLYQIALLSSPAGGTHQLPEAPASAFSPLWFRRGMLFAALLAVLTLTAAGGFALYDFMRTQFLNPAPGQLISDLYTTVRQATDAEFAAYRQVPDSDLSNLETYFDKQGSAYAKIKQAVEGSAAQKRILSNPGNPSAHELLGISLHEMNGDEAIVKTREYWYLRWFDTQKNEYVDYVYKETNEQYYVLVWRRGRWLIKSNAYPPASGNEAKKE